MFIASEDEIKAGKITDIYFVRTVDVIKKSGKDKKVRMEFHAYSLPKDYEWAVFAGLEEALEILKGRDVTVYALKEGTLFEPKWPLMVIEGRYSEFGVLETALLGVLRHSTSIATKAARIKAKAGKKTVLYFGLRALHPAIAPMADRAAYIGGVDGVAGAFNEETIGVKPSGTMPHALIIIFGDQVSAWLAFDKYVPVEVPRIALVDTFWDEREEALLAAKALKEKLAGVRLDTPSSRRGNMRRIIEEVRWTLELHGYKTKIYVSGGIDEKQVEELKDVVDGFGVGTAISNAPSVDISADIVEVFESSWVPRTKRGKLPGFKQVYKCKDGFKVAPWGSLKCEGLLRKVMEGGKIVVDLPSPKEIREYVLQQLRERGYDV